MGEVPRRTFCALLAAWAGTASGCTTMSQDQSAATDRQGDSGNVTVVTTRRELESAFGDLSPGDTIRITDENAPYRTTQWLDIDVDGVTVLGPGVRTLIKPADNADVGGIRIGHNSRCAEIDIRGVGYHGNPSGQPKRAERLHGIAVRNATNVTVQRSYVRRTYPVKHGNGGSGISVTHNCSGVRIFNNQIHAYGDRGIQIAGKRHVVFGNVVTNGLDRPIACDLWPSESKNPTAQSVSIFGNLLGDSIQGSLMGIARNTSSSKAGYVGIFGNVGFGTHKSFCHVRGPKPLRNVNIQNNVSLQKTDDLATKQTTDFAGVAVDAAKVRNLAIKNNEFYDYSGHGIRVDSDVSDMTIQQNTLASPGLAGIRFVGGADSLVDGNLITDAAEAGIRLKGVADTVVRGNFVRGAGTAGIVVGGSESPTGNEIAANYVKNSNRNSSKSFPAILIRDSGVRVRANSVRQNSVAAIAEADGVEGNLYEENRADGDDPWQFASPASRARNNDPPTGVHRGVSADSGTAEVSVAFDRPYSRPPKLSFGRANGGVRGVSYATNESGNFVGATVTLGESGGTLDAFVNDP